MVKYHAEFPMSTVPDWFPHDLVSAKQEALGERLAFLTALSMKPTLTRYPSVSGGSCKHKLALTPIKELTDIGPPCKKQRTFINTPSELMKDFSALLS